MNKELELLPGGSGCWAALIPVCVCVCEESRSDNESGTGRGPLIPPHRYRKCSSAGATGFLFWQGNPSTLWCHSCHIFGGAKCMHAVGQHWHEDRWEYTHRVQKGSEMSLFRGLLHHKKGGVCSGSWSTVGCGCCWGDMERGGDEEEDVMPRGEWGRRVKMEDGEEDASVSSSCTSVPPRWGVVGMLFAFLNRHRFLGGIWASESDIYTTRTTRMQIHGNAIQLVYPFKDIGIIKSTI